MESSKILVFTLLVLQTFNLIAAQIKDDDITIFRLPKDLVPEKYDLSLHIAPDKDDFSGAVTITFQLIDEASVVEYIYLHADSSYVTITLAKLNDVDNCTFENLNNNVVKFFCGNLTEQSNLLYIEFKGKYSETDGYGLVKTTYTDQNKKQSLIESYFQPTFARRAFPCFDEPDFKATFSIAITYPTGYTAISNSISEDTLSEDDYTTTTFQSTPNISTYLVSIFVSKFKETVAAVSNEYSFKFLTRPGLEDVTTNVAGAYYTHIMDALSNFTGQSFQSIGDTECYQVAIPDYYSEHMGNFGLFAYKERDLLDEGDKTTSRVTQNILQAMVYKISHEWFGGEVSTTWWSDFWANEAVPMYFKYVIPHQINEGFELIDQFVVEVVQKSMQRDAMPFVEALSSEETEVSNEWSIENKLDQYSLLKGATLLHMINFMVGSEDQFIANIYYHLQNRTDSDTDGENMLEDLTQYDGIQDLYSASKSWAFTAGFPLLIVKINDTTDEKKTLSFSQKRFVYPMNNTFFNDDTKWTIPISYTTSSKKSFDTVINVYYAPNLELYISNLRDDWVLFNVQGRFHYRVNYEDELWWRIINVFQIETERSEIHPLSRAQVIDDIFNIARTGQVEYSLAFELANSLVYETEYYPLYSAFNAFSYLMGKMKDSDVEERLKSYILTLVDQIVNIPDFDFTNKDNETHIDVLKRIMVLDWACRLGHSECVNFAIEQFANFKENRTSMIDYNLRPVILCNGLRYSKNTSEDWKFLFSLYQSSSSVHEQYDILQALGCAEDERTLLNYLLKLSVPLYSAYIKRQDTMVVFESVLSSAVGIKAAMSFLGSSLKYIQFIFNGGTDEVYTLSDMVLALAEKLTTDDQMQWLQDILNDGVFNGYEDLRTKAKTLTTVNNYWAKQYQDVIEALLPEATSSSTTIESTSTTDYTISSSTEFIVTPVSTAEPTVSSTVEPIVSTSEPTVPTEESTSAESSTTTESSGETIFVSQIVVLISVLFLIM